MRYGASISLLIVTTFRSRNTPYRRIFGSVARNKATENSDLDFLIEFTKKPALLDLFAVRHFLEDLFHCPIDLDTEQSPRQHLRAPTLRDAIHTLRRLNLP